MTVLDFFRLERTVQERFVAAARGAVPPTPLAYRPPPLSRGALALWGGSLLASAALIVSLSIGFGSLSSRFAILPQAFAVVFAVLAATSVFLGIRAQAMSFAVSSLPYRSGLYLFPACVVDAKGEKLEVFRIGELGEPEQHGSRVVVPHSGGRRFEFDLGDASRAEQAKTTFAQYRVRLIGSESGPPSSRELASLDPLLETGFKNPLAPPQPMDRPSLGVFRFGWLVAIVVGGLFGPLVWYGRNVLSEERLYFEARSRNDSASYRQYLDRGGHRGEVAEIALPRAELADAVRAGTVSAIEQYAGSHPQSKIGEEVEAALRAALLRELGAATAKNSLTALVEFEKQQKNARLVSSELQAAKERLFVEAGRRFAANVPPGSEDVVPAFERLLAHSRKNGPEVQLHFRRRPSETSEDTEALLQKSAYYLGPNSLPAQYFQPVVWEPREADVGRQIVERLNQEFPPDILHFTLGPALDDPAEVPVLDRPALLITHREEMNGIFLSKQPRGAFVGLGFFIRVLLITPGAEPLSYKYTHWLTPSLKPFQEGGAPKDVYEASAREGMDRFRKKFLAYLLKQP